jgi:hypothetical protein
VLSTDEGVFTISGVHNLHNLYEWATENPHDTRHSSFQQTFNANVWAAEIVNYIVIGPCLIRDRPGREHYAYFLEKKLPHILEGVSLHVVRVCDFSSAVPPSFAIGISFPDRWTDVEV